MRHHQWIIAIGALGAVVCVLLSITRLGSTGSRDTHNRIKRKVRWETIFEENWKLATLAHVLYVHRGFFLGDTNSSQVVDWTWKLEGSRHSGWPYEVFNAQFIEEASFESLSDKFLETADFIENMPSGPNDTLDYWAVFVPVRIINEINEDGEKVIIATMDKMSNVSYSDINKMKTENNWTLIGEEVDASLRCLNSLDQPMTAEALIEHVRLECENVKLNESTIAIVKKANSTIRDFENNIVSMISVAETFLKYHEMRSNLTNIPKESMQKAIVQVKNTAAKYKVIKTILSQWESLKGGHLALCVEEFINKIDGRTTLLRNLINYDIFSTVADNDIFLSSILNAGNGLELLLTAIEPVKPYMEEMRRLENLFRKVSVERYIYTTLRQFSRFLPPEMKEQEKRLVNNLNLLDCLENPMFVEYPEKDEVEKWIQKGRAFVDWAQKNQSTQISDNSFANLDFWPAIRDGFLEIVERSRANKSATLVVEELKMANRKMPLDQVKQVLTLVKNFTMTIEYDNKYQVENVKKIWSELKAFGEKVYSKGIMVPACKTVIFNPESFHRFAETYSTYQQFKKENLQGPLRSYVERALRPLQMAQRVLRNLTDIATKLHDHAFSYPIYADELSLRLEQNKGSLEDIAQAAQHFDRLRKYVYEAESIMFLVKNADVVIEESFKITSKDLAPSRIRKAYEELMTNEQKLRKMLADIKELHRIDHGGDWRSVADLSVVYVNASMIEGVELKGLFPVMSMFSEDQMMANATLHTARHLAERVGKLDIDWKESKMAMQRAAESLKRIEEPIARFFRFCIIKPAKYVWKFNFAHIAFTFVEYFCYFFAVYTIYIYWTRNDGMRPRKKKTVDEPFFVVTKENWEHIPQMLQEARLPINQRDENGKTALFRAVEEDNYTLAKMLAEQGAAINATCGPTARTALHVAVINKNPEMVNLLFKHGAMRYTLDTNGKTPKKYCYKGMGSNHIDGLFAKYRDIKVDRVIPKVQRDFYVLIVEPEKFAEENVALLPERLDVVYGYREWEVNLDDFTHFVIDPLKEGNNDLHLDFLFKLPFWEILAKPGMIVSSAWLNACLDDPAAVDDDWKFQLKDISFEKFVHKDRAILCKNAINRLRPPLLAGASIHTSPTEKYHFIREDWDHWQRVIEAFGGTVVKEPLPSHEDAVLYHNFFSESFAGAPLYPSIVLMFKDSIIFEKWTYPENHITVVGWAWLPESIARYSLLPPDHGVFRYEPKPSQLHQILDRGSRYN
ncbi:unnamed protein product [Caenorhabditis sp. 36 PRJEB53466]|nr:unnamed protein product [Caenorhabditis sp. 36 PRJEB53466]